mmetsp:Transcript_34213/g.74760  ORF Transcript_34213/g.74760 Transcript_34213/m.74760 type:complete len:228 (-) Transcript_34213:203-886(-)
MGLWGYEGTKRQLPLLVVGPQFSTGLPNDVQNVQMEAIVPTCSLWKEAASSTMEPRRPEALAPASALPISSTSPRCNAAETSSERRPSAAEKMRAKRREPSWASRAAAMRSPSCPASEPRIESRRPPACCGNDASSSRLEWTTRTMSSRSAGLRTKRGTSCSHKTPEASATRCSSGRRFSRRSASSGSLESTLSTARQARLLASGCPFCTSISARAKITEVLCGSCA